ncbi:MAG: LysR family transcriptional regulator [Eubacteriales bacterium]|nr:LysR family transcriptional regulator [Eubacteriales bacterium]
MDIRTLNYFVVVAEELNITRAAEKLKICQPPLSNQIKLLEEELDTVLFIRGRRKLELTDSGKLLYRRAKEILDLTDKAKSEIKSMSKGMTGTVSIGLVEGSAPNIAAKWIEVLANQYPNLRFRIMDGNSESLITMLRSGLINLAIITAPVDHTLLNTIPVGREKLSAYIHVDHPLAKRPGNTIDLKDLVGERVITPTRPAIIELVYKWFKKVNAEPNIICEMDNYLDIVAITGSNIGISIFPKADYHLGSSIIMKEIVNPENYLEYHFVWLKGRPLPKAEEAFIDYVRSVAEN